MFSKPLTIALTAVGLLGVTACERDKADEDVVIDKDIEAEGAKTAEPGIQPGTQPGTQPGMQPGTQPGMQPGTQPEGGEGQISADMQRRIDAAQERFAKLEREAKDAKERITARGGEVRTELEQDLERAKMEAQTKLENLRKASAQNANEAINEAEKALNDLEDKLKKYDQT